MLPASPMLPPSPADLPVDRLLAAEAEILAGIHTASFGSGCADDGFGCLDDDELGEDVLLS